VPGVAEFERVDVLGVRFRVDDEDAAAGVALALSGEVDVRQLPLAGAALGVRVGVQSEQDLRPVEARGDGGRDRREALDVTVVDEHPHALPPQGGGEGGGTGGVRAGVTDEDVPLDGQCLRRCLRAHQPH
jgi:hypothetical protein